MTNHMLAVGYYAAWIYEQSPDDFRRFAKKCRYGMFVHAAISNIGRMYRRAKSESPFWYKQLAPDMEHTQRVHIQKYLKRLFSDKSNPHYADVHSNLGNLFSPELYENLAHRYHEWLREITAMIGSIYANEVFDYIVTKELERFANKRDAKAVAKSMYIPIYQMGIRSRRQVAIIKNYHTVMETCYDDKGKYHYKSRGGYDLYFVDYEPIVELYALCVADADLGGLDIDEFRNKRDFQFIEMLSMIRKVSVALGGGIYVPD